MPASGASSADVAAAFRLVAALALSRAVVPGGADGLEQLAAAAVIATIHTTHTTHRAHTRARAVPACSLNITCLEKVATRTSIGPSVQPKDGSRLGS